MQVGASFEGRYRIDELIHDGTKSRVIAATHLGNASRVAIKIQKTATNPEFLARFMSEARLASRLGSEHVVGIYDFGMSDDGPYLVMELVDGPSVARMLANGPLPRPQAIAITQQLCAALAAIHATGIVYRNVEPANVLVDARSMIKLVDFFFARPIGAPAVAAGTTLVGAPPYTAPEQLREPTAADARSDIWSVGVLLCTMIAGRPPFWAPSFAELIAAMHDGVPPTLPIDLGPTLSTVIARCLALDPAARYQSAGELAADL